MKEKAYLLTWRGDVFRDASDSPLYRIPRIRKGMLSGIATLG